MRRKEMPPVFLMRISLTPVPLSPGPAPKKVQADPNHERSIATVEATRDTGCMNLRGYDNAGFEKLSEK